MSLALFYTDGTDPVLDIEDIEMGVRKQKKYYATSQLKRRRLNKLVAVK